MTSCGGLRWFRGLGQGGGERHDREQQEEGQARNSFDKLCLFRYVVLRSFRAYQPPRQPKRVAVCSLPLQTLFPDSVLVNSGDAMALKDLRNSVPVSLEAFDC